MLNVVINQPERSRQDKNTRAVVSLGFLFLVPYLVMLLLGASGIGFAPGYWTLFALNLAWNLVKPGGFPISLTRLPGEK